MINLSLMIWKNLGRNVTRTLLTMLSIYIAFLLFGVLSGIDQVFESERNVGDHSLERIVTSNRLTWTKSLPATYYNSIKQLDGILASTREVWFGAYFRERDNRFPHYAVDPEDYRAVYPEYRIEEQQFAAWQRTKNGIVATRGLAARYGWELNDAIPLFSDIYPRLDSSMNWHFTLVGYLDGKEGSEPKDQVLMRYDFFQENNFFQAGLTDRYISRVGDAGLAQQYARDIDALLASAPISTRSRVDSDFGQQFRKRYEHIGLVVLSVLAAVFFTILLVTASTMAQSVRERFEELLVLRVLGFKEATVAAVIIFEGILMALAGGISGLLSAWGIIKVAAPLVSENPMFEGIGISPATCIEGMLLMVLMGTAATLFPALQVIRADVAAISR